MLATTFLTQTCLSKRRVLLPPAAPAPVTEEWTWKPVKAGRHRQHASSNEEAGDYPWQPMRTNGDRQSAGGFFRPLREVFRRQSYECAFCGGTGEKSEGSRCPVCHSKGSVKIKPPVVKCPCCHDCGEVPRNSGVTCPVCKGKGWVSIKEPIEVCRSCNGRGRKTGEGLYCSPCRGTGVVQVKGARASTPQASQARVMSLEVGSRPHRVSVQPNEREVLEILQDEGGVMGKSQLARFMGVTSVYAESLCRKLTGKGCLEEVDIKTFALTPVGEAIGRAALAKTKAKEQKERASQDKRKKKVQAVRDAARAEMQAVTAQEGGSQ